MYNNRNKTLDNLCNAFIGNQISFNTFFNKVYETGVHNYEPWAVMNYCRKVESMFIKK